MSDRRNLITMPRQPGTCLSVGRLVMRVGAVKSLEKEGRA